MAVTFRTLDTFDTEFSADSVEWCPVEPFRDLVVCGTYQLTQKRESMKDRKGCKRLGRIYMLRATDGKLTILQRFDVPAVLDMKWMHVADSENRALLAVANAIGHVQIYQLRNEQDAILELIMEQRISNDDDDVLALSLDWSTGKYASEPCIVVSDSLGKVSQFALHGNDLMKNFSWRAHDFEAWIVAYDYWDTHRFYSGGDDCKFQAFDDRVGCSSVAHSNVHNAGVTSIHCNADREFVLASGSYDEILRLWDKRSLKLPVSETNLRSGIWRLKWDPFSHRYLFAACMYNGFKIIQCRSEDSPSIIGEYNEHDSISYGCDWSFLREENSSDVQELESKFVGTLVATCSFYDHILKLSSLYIESGNLLDSCK